MSNKVKIALHIVLLLLSVYLGYIFGNIFSPRVQIYLDLANYDNTASVESFVYDREYESLYPDNSGKYSISYNIYNKDINLVFNVVDKKPSNVTVNGDDFTDIQWVGEFSDYYNAYTYTYALKINVESVLYYPAIVLFSIIFMATLEYILNKILLLNKESRYKLIYSKSSLEEVGKKPIVLSYIVTLCTLVFYYGTDINMVAQTLEISRSGVDIFQLFGCLNSYKGIELYLWQYEGIMLAFYKLVTFFSYLPLKFDVNGYHWLYAVFIKLVNITLLNMSVLSVLSFLMDHNLISKKLCKNIYYWSIFNPMTFYVCIIFIQFDAFPLYFLTTGLLLLDDIDQNKILPFFMVAVGIATKISYLMCMPVIGVVGLILLINKLKKKEYLIIKEYVFFIAMLLVLFAGQRLINTPIKVAYSQMRATERMWWTTIQYAPSVFIFLTFLGLELVFILNYIKVSLRVSVVDIIQNSLYIIATLILVFSGSLLSTPGIFISTLPAFIMLYNKQEDNFGRFIIAAGALPISFLTCLTDVGDITNSIKFFGGVGIFTKIVMGPSASKWMSLIYTISNSAMFAYAIIFFKEAGKHFKKNKTVEEG